MIAFGILQLENMVYSKQPYRFTVKCFFEICIQSSLYSFLMENYKVEFKLFLSPLPL